MGFSSGVNPDNEYPTPVKQGIDVLLDLVEECNQNTYCCSGIEIVYNTVDVCRQSTQECDSQDCSDDGSGVVVWKVKNRYAVSEQASGTDVTAALALFIARVGSQCALGVNCLSCFGYKAATITSTVVTILENVCESGPIDAENLFYDLAFESCINCVYIPNNISCFQEKGCDFKLDARDCDWVDWEFEYIESAYCTD